MENSATVKTDNVLTFIKPEGKLASLKIGTVLKADVMEIIESGMVSLRIVPPGSKGENAWGKTVRARTHVPMTRGDNILLKVLNSDNDIRMKFIGVLNNRSMGLKTLTEYLPKKILEMMSELSYSRIKSSDFRIMKEMFQSLPEKIKGFFPEFKVFERLMPGIEQLNNVLLERSIVESGILFESRLKLTILQELKKSANDILDQKELLIKIRELLKNDKAINVLKNSGVKYGDLVETVERFIKNIEFFQLTSRINDILYTFLPVSWHELNDGELLFRRKLNDESDSYTCDVNLDLETLGKLSISITTFDGNFYISFNTERSDIKTLIEAEKGFLEKRFIDSGLILKSININQRNNITFGVNNRQDVDLVA